MWTEMFNSSDVNNSVKIFINKVSQITDSSTTIKLENSKNKKIKEWMTQGLLCSICHKQELSLKLTKTLIMLNLSLIITNIKINLQQY